MNRAYSVLELKSVDDEQRMLEGIATTPSPDRLGDIVETDGIEFKIPLPLLYQHNSRQPIGNVIAAKVSKAGITIKAKLAPPGIAPFIDEAWALIKAGLVRGLSIGFRPLEHAYMDDSDGVRFIRSEWIELSAVTIPANAEANILTVKSADALLLAASGTKQGVVRLDSTVNRPGVTGSPEKKNMTIAEQITQFENKRASNVARMSEIMKKSGETGSTLDHAEEEEHDTLQAEVESINKHIHRLKVHEKTLVANATPVLPDAGVNPQKAAEQRSGIVTVKSNLPKGTTMSRWVMAHVNFKGDMYRAAEQARTLWPDSPEMETIFRAAVAAGTTTGTTWAAPLVPAAQNMMDEFIELLRPATVLGRIPGLRRVPVNISIPTQTGGGTFGWVGEGAAKPVSAMAFAAVTLRWSKAAGIVVLTKELIRFSSPNAEAVVRDSMIKDTAQFLDAQFVSAVAANGDISPAGIRNGATTAAATGVTAAFFLADFKTALATFIAANDDLSKLVILMSSTSALNVSTLKDSLGNMIYPTLSMAGGTLLGIPVVVSEAVGNNIIFLNAGDILLADDGPIEIDASDQASIVMDDAPQASPQTTSLVSLYQRNLVALRVEKFITWKKARSTSVYYISTAAYTG